MKANRCIEVCNELLRGELSAVATYQQALGKFMEPADHQALHEILEDHTHSAGVLRELVIAQGALPAQDAGMWGNLTKFLESAAVMLGESSALNLLRAGERHGISEYQHALEDRELMQEIKTRISSDLLPSLSRHINTLEMLAA